MSEVKVPRGDAGGVLDDLVRRVGDLERRMRVRGDARLKLAADDPGATLLEFLSANYGGNGCSPVPGGSLQTDETIDTVTTGNALVACDTTLTSSGLDQWLTATNFTWTAAKACTVFVSFSAFVQSGGTVNTLSLSAGGAGGVAATAGDAVTLSASDIVTLDAADTLQLILTHDGGGTASVSGARFNVLIVCAASGGSIPD